MPEVFISAGSNIDPQQHLRRALAALYQIYHPVSRSPVYRNRAVGFDGDDFWNCVVGFATDQDAASLVTELRDVEDACGRDRDLPRFGPRSVDLDLILYGDFIGELDGLGLPRREVLEQAYILKPLSDLAPDGLHPVTNQSYSQHWAEFDRTSHVLTEVDLDCG